MSFYKNSKSFSLPFPGISRIIGSKVSISEPTTDATLIDSIHKEEYLAIWDTGATNSVITPKIINDFKLQGAGMVEVNNTSGKSDRESYFVNIYLPNGLVVPFVKVTGCDALSGDFDLLIGMDIINMGDFTITNFKGKTTFTFRMPSCYEVNYVKEFNDGILSRVGRNDLCFCGSGKKFKNCCKPKLESFKY